MHLKNSPPRCLKDFTVSYVDLQNLKFDGHGEETNTIFNVICKCGCANHRVYGYYWDNPSYEKKVFIGPLKTQCISCTSENEIFDIVKYGYDAEFENGCYSKSGEGEFSLFCCDGCRSAEFKLIARFEYPDDLDDEDFDDIRGREQDFFTWFSLHGRCAKCDLIVDICDYECA